LVNTDFYDSSSGFCFDFVQQSRCSSSLSMAFAVRTQSTTACESR
jgi:hypothetical protein